MIGADLEQVGKFQQCSSPLDNATAGGSVLIELTSDISLDGNPLPPVHGSVKASPCARKFAFTMLGGA